MNWGRIETEGLLGRTESRNIGGGEEERENKG